MADQSQYDAARDARRRRRADKLAAIGRAPTYLFPRQSRLFGWSLIAASVLWLAMVGLYMTGARQTFSPGLLATHHASLDASCEQCHETGRNVVTVRCERCHDTSFEDRLLHTSHTALGMGEASAADLAREVGCVTCHRDHQGRDFATVQVPDAECAACHRPISSLAGHPEFAAVAAGTSASAGMIFGHEGHLNTYLPDVSQAGCAYCHVPSADNRGFEPVDFTTSCAGSACHTTAAGDLSLPSSRVQTNLVLAPTDLPAYWRRDTRIVSMVPDRRAGFSQGLSVSHRDGWVIANALRLGQALDPAGFSAERAALEMQLLAYDEARYLRTIGTLDTAALTRTIERVEQEIAGLDARLESPAAQGTDVAALQAMAAFVQELSAQLPDTSGLALPADQASAVGLGAASAQGGRVAADVEARKAELVALLDAIDARTGDGADPALLAQSAALRQQVESLSATDATGEDDPAALVQRVRDLQATIRAALAIAGPGGAATASTLEALRDETGPQVAGGVSPLEYARVRQQLFSVLDAIDGRGDTSLRSDTASIRQSLLSLPASLGDRASLESSRTARQRLLDRLRVEATLRAAPDFTRASPSPTPTRPDRPGEARHRQDDRTRLAHLQQALTALPAGSASDDDLERALRAVTASCTKCHTSVFSRAGLDRVRIDEPLMSFAVFNHAPHVTLPGGCESCHDSARTSTLASDVNLPGVATCQQCHTPNQVRATCVTCHTYHAPGLNRSR